MTQNREDSFGSRDRSEERGLAVSEPSFGKEHPTAIFIAFYYCEIVNGLYTLSVFKVYYHRVKITIVTSIILSWEDR